MGGGYKNNPETLLEHRTVLQQTQGMHVHVDDRLDHRLYILPTLAQSMHQRRCTNKHSKMKRIADCSVKV